MEAALRRSNLRIELASRYRQRVNRNPKPKTEE
jgi:hypothetical protein